MIYSKIAKNTVKNPLDTACSSLLLALIVVSFCTASPGARGGEDARLVDAAAARDHAAVETLLHEGADVNAARADGATALLFAAHWNDVALAELLLRAGADVNAADDHGVTPLALASENAGLDMVEALLNAGADPDAAEVLSGLTPLMTAVRTGNHGVVGALLQHGADVNAATYKTHNTPAMWAVSGRDTGMVRLLAGAGADLHVSTARGLTLLMLAARNGDVEMAEALLNAGVDPNATGSAGMHALPFAVVAGQAEFARFLLEQGADPDGGLAGIRALHAAAGNVRPWLAEWNQQHALLRLPNGVRPVERPALVDALLASGADPNARIAGPGVDQDYLAHPRRGAFQTYSCGTGDLRGATPLWIAAREANGNPRAEAVASGDVDARLQVLRALLAAGADPAVVTDDGTTPLMAAAGLGQCTNDYTLRRGRRSRGAEAAVATLLDAGADINAVNEGDFAALHGAAFRGLNEVVGILVDRGADIDARDFRGRTPYRLAQGSKQSFYFQEYPETAEFIAGLGADTAIGLAGNVQERLRDVAVEDEISPR